MIEPYMTGFFSKEIKLYVTEGSLRLKIIQELHNEGHK